MVHYFNILIISSLVGLSLSLMVKIDGIKDKYCFYKKIYDEEKINLSFMVSSEKKEELNVYFMNEDSRKTIFETDYQQQSGEYKDKAPLPAGRYSLCFYPRDRNVYFISFELYSQFEGASAFKELANDKEFKKMSSEVIDIRNVFQVIETNLKQGLDRKSRHLKILVDIINSIKNLTFLKGLIVLLLSLFQIVVIQKIFGPDKRVTSVKGAFSDGL